MLSWTPIWSLQVSNLIDQVNTHILVLQSLTESILFAQAQRKEKQLNKYGTCLFKKSCLQNVFRTRLDLGRYPLKEGKGAVL